MAAADTVSPTNSDLMSFLCEEIVCGIQRVHPSLEKTDIKLVKRSRRLDKGDFTVMFPSMLKKRHVDVDSDRENFPLGLGLTSENDMGNDKIKLDFNCFHMDTPSELYFDYVKPGELALRLSRRDVFQASLSLVNSMGSRYGCSMVSDDDVVEGVVMMNTGLHSEHGSPDTMTLDHARSRLLSEHISALLESQGFEVQPVEYAMSETWQELGSQLGLRPFSTCGSETSPVDEEPQSLYERLQLSPFCTILDTTSQCLPSSEAKSCGDRKEPILLDLRQFIQHKSLHDYDPNVNLCSVSHHSDLFRSLSSLEERRKTLEPTVPVFALHVTSRHREFQQQLLDLSWQVVMASDRRHIRQCHVPHGPVTSRGGQREVSNLNDFIRLRTKQMKKAAVLKYGDSVEGADWYDTIRALTSAEIKFELLSTGFKQPVKLGVLEETSTGASTDTKGGVFVLYNCARLANLFRNFETAVSEGVFPALPDVSTIDFSLLREEEEWSLLFNFVLVYPSVLSEAMGDIRGETLKPSLHTHKVCQFLQDLCRDLSSYYSRVHILGEPRAHLLPVMYARLWLMKGVRTVLTNGLATLNIPPVAQL